MCIVVGITTACSSSKGTAGNIWIEWIRLNIGAETDFVTQLAELKSIYRGMLLDHAMSSTG